MKKCAVCKKEVNLATGARFALCGDCATGAEIVKADGKKAAIDPVAHYRDGSGRVNAYKVAQYLPTYLAVELAQLAITHVYSGSMRWLYHEQVRHAVAKMCPELDAYMYKGDADAESH